MGEFSGYAVLDLESRTKYDHSFQAYPIATGTNQVAVIVVRGRARSDRRNCFVKVNCNVIEEVIGTCGQYDDEIKTLLYAFKIKPCTYPPCVTWFEESAMTSHCEDRLDLRKYETITIDSHGTQDKDDAFCWMGDGMQYGGRGILAIHVTDVSSRLTDDALEWASQRCTSVYYTSSCGKPMCVPMLPPSVTRELSLNDGADRHAITLFLEHDDKYKVVNYRHARTVVRTDRSFAYGKCDRKHPAVLALLAMSETTEDDLAVEWAMVQYNAYFGSHLRAEGDGVFRVQAQTDVEATYSMDGASSFHAALGKENYAHCSSPLRRYVDLYNQRALRGKRSPIDVQHLNTRCSATASFGKAAGACALASLTWLSPSTATAVVTKREGSKVLKLKMFDKVITSPLAGSYYADSIASIVESWGESGTEVIVTVCGVLAKGRLTPRFRLGDEKGIEHFLDQFGGADRDETSLHICGKTALCTPPRALQSAGTAVARTMAHPDEFERILGHAMDTFQRDCFLTIARGIDLLAVAPTGSGKTAVALAAIYNAFAHGMDAIYTSPIKALSNQKYAEFQLCFASKGVDAGVTLITGDICIRSSHTRQLLICTSEILRNKLVCGSQASFDLSSVHVVVMDEVHYINDCDRGSVWEESIMCLPASVRLVALSATIAKPVQFAKWLSARSQTEVVCRQDRHVPLHVGTLWPAGFVEVYCTHAPGRICVGDFAKSLRGTSERVGPDVQSLACSARCERDRELKNMSRTPHTHRRPEQPSQTIHVFDAQAIVRNLRDAAMMPAIVFNMSRKGCHSLARSARQESVRETDLDARDAHEALHALRRTYLRRHEAVLCGMEFFCELMDMIQWGVAYHHSGMLPILREFVEVCFFHKVVQVVFATETLAVGINMPAKTVVFTQITKPEHHTTRRLLRPDEFWQMAGRAGRRGFDAHGFVVFAFTSARDSSLATSARDLIEGSMPALTSKLKVDMSFVLRASLHGGRRFFDSTLLHREGERAHEAANENTHTLSPAAIEYARLQQLATGAIGGVRVKQPQSQLKRAKAALHVFLDTHPERALKDELSRMRLIEDGARLTPTVNVAWDQYAQELRDRGCLDHSNELTATGAVCVAFLDYPLSAGILIVENVLRDLDDRDVCAWLALFCNELRVDASDSNRVASSFSLPLHVALAKTEARIGKTLNVYFANLLLLWMDTHQLASVANYIPSESIGHFVKGVVKVASDVDVLDTVFEKLLRHDERHKLIHVRDRLFSGIVGNESLYVNT